jgi:methionyl-tRNA formyltransferase
MAEIDWSKPAAEVYNLIRAVNPAPGAWTRFKGQKFDIFDARKVDGSGQPGEILGVSDDGVTVAAAGGAVLVKRVRGEGQKVPAAEFAASTGLKAGDKLDAPEPKQSA